MKRLFFSYRPNPDKPDQKGVSRKAAKRTKKTYIRFFSLNQTTGAPCAFLCVFAALRDNILVILRSFLLLSNSLPNFMPSGG